MFRTSLALCATIGLVACGAASESATDAVAAPADPPAEAPTKAEKAPPPPPFEMPPIVAGTAPDNPYSAEQIALGKKLLTFGSCHDCHTPWTFDPKAGAPSPDFSRALSGHPLGGPDPGGDLGPGDIALIGPTFTSFKLPFGVVYSANLTPDTETGSGNWTEEQFLKIFREGKHLGLDGGRGVLPPMPWQMIRSLPDEDLVAIFAYLRSVPPIKNAVPGPKVPAEVVTKITDGNAKFVSGGAH